MYKLVDISESNLSFINAPLLFFFLQHYINVFYTMNIYIYITKYKICLIK